jgi:hypothetical protein
MAKLFSFKLVVGLTFIQTVGDSSKSYPSTTNRSRELTSLGQILWMILESTHVLEPSSTMTYADWNIILPALLVCVEMVPLSAFVVYAYPSSPYAIGERGSASDSELASVPVYTPSYQGGALGHRAFAAMLSPTEIFAAIKFSFTMVKEGKARKKLEG